MLRIVWENNYAAQSEDKYESFGVVKYTNSNYAGDPKGKKSIIRYCFFISGAIVTWCGKQ